MKNINRELHKIDAADKSAGRLASQIAILLRGKNKPEYQPNLDSGDRVLVINADKLKFSGKKMSQKKYYKYSGYPGGLKEINLKDLFKSRPSEVLRRAVKQMLPPTKLRDSMMRRLVIK